MNQKLLAAVAVIATIALAILLFLRTGKAGPGMTGQNATESGAIASLKDALTGSSSIKCEYTDPQSRSGTIYIKNGQVRVEGYGEENQISYSIFTGQKNYIWNPTTKEGFAFTVPQVTPGAAVTPAQGDLNTAVQTLNGYEQKCSPSNVDDSMFVPPTDINFQDFSAMMQGVGKDLPKEMKQIPTGLPYQ